MGQLFAAIKALGAVSTLLTDLLSWFKELRRKKAIDAADEQHTQNSDAIARAFRAPDIPGLCDNSPANQPHPPAPIAPAISSGPRLST